MTRARRGGALVFVRNFLAPFTLPSGAEIDLMCIDDDDPSSIPVVAVYLEMI